MIYFLIFYSNFSFKLLFNEIRYNLYFDYEKKNYFFLILYYLFSSDLAYSKDINPTIQPEPSSEKEKLNKYKFGKFENFVIVTANDYATRVGYQIIEKGGNAADAAVAIQMMLGLVEPQSSGLGGGIFITYYDQKTKRKNSFEGREKAPQKLQNNIFLNDDGKPKKFFDAVVGGSSVGVPGTLDALYKVHQKFGKLSWKEVIEPVIRFSEKGFTPSNRLINALKKEKYLFEIYPKSIFKKILEEPKKKFFNSEYTSTLKKLSQDYKSFYTAKIAEDIVKTTNQSDSPGALDLSDMKNYKSIHKKALCHKLTSNYEVCGPNLPSSGTICVVQSLILFEKIFADKIKSNATFSPDLNKVLEILDFVYFLRDKYLGDPDYVYINKQKLFNKNFLFKTFKSFKKDSKVSTIQNIDEILNSTSHFSIVDKSGNVLSATSSIESSFGSRLLTNGFFLNNQLTDFSFKIRDDEGNLIKNRPAAGKRPLSSMSPLIIFDENENFLMTLGSPGGKAIISYVFKSLISILYSNSNIKEAIEGPNYIKIRGKIFIENEKLNKKLTTNGVKRNLTSGLGII